MAGEGVGTNIPLNPAKTRTIGKGWKMVIKERGEQPEGGSRKKKEKKEEQERENEKSLYLYSSLRTPIYTLWIWFLCV